MDFPSSLSRTISKIISHFCHSHFVSKGLPASMTVLFSVKDMLLCVQLCRVACTCVSSWVPWLVWPCSWSAPRRCGPSSWTLGARSDPCCAPSFCLSSHCKRCSTEGQRSKIEVKGPQEREITTDRLRGSFWLKQDGVTV